MIIYENYGGSVKNTKISPPIEVTMPLTHIETHKVKPKEGVLEVHNLPRHGVW